MACSCQQQSPFQKVSGLWENLMQVRQDLDTEGYAWATKILSDIDTLRMHLQHTVEGTAVPLYGNPCDSPQEHCGHV